MSVPNAMKINNHYITHFALMAAIAAIIVLSSALPFFPGRYFDGVLTLAFFSQLFGLASVVLVPAGLVWLWYRRRKWNRFSALPLYLMLVPSIALFAQLMLATYLTDRSRNVAIQNSREMIADIEAYRTEHGRYPISLFGVWPDYSPGIVGIAQYHYEQNGKAYNITFEQPRFLLDDIGTREFVMYNPRDEHAMTSHAAWRLTQPELRGWYDLRDAGEPRWKSFLFD